MFNKGKPYVPPPTRAMGSTQSSDDLHDIDDELELEAEILDEQVGTSAQPTYSPAPEVPEPARPQTLAAATPEPAASPTTYGTFGQSGHEPLTASGAGGTPPVAAASGGGAGSGSGGSSSGGSGWGSSSGGNGGNNRGNPPSRPTREVTSVLGNGMTFEGDISGVGQLVIEGTVKGDVRVSHVLINQNGSVEGTVHADVLEVRGKVTGAIVAKQVHLHASSRVEGDITQEQLTVDRGAWFSGRSTQAKRAEEDSAPPPASDPTGE